MPFSCRSLPFSCPPNHQCRTNALYQAKDYSKSAAPSQSSPVALSQTSQASLSTTVSPKRLSIRASIALGTNMIVNLLYLSEITCMPTDSRYHSATSSIDSRATTRIAKTRSQSFHFLLRLLAIFQRSPHAGHHGSTSPKRIRPHSSPAGLRTSSY